jgi:hypothetical protein
MAAAKGMTSALDGLDPVMTVPDSLCWHDKLQWPLDDPTVLTLDGSDHLAAISIGGSVQGAMIFQVIQQKASGW